MVFGWRRRRAMNQFDVVGSSIEPAIPEGSLVPASESMVIETATEFTDLDKAFTATIEARVVISRLQEALDWHHYNAHYSVTQDCDVLCVPELVDQLITSLDIDMLRTVSTLLVKEWYWRQAAMEQWRRQYDETETDG